jgi:hypothetical protein
MEEQSAPNEKKKTTSEKLWDSTRKTLHVAGFQANKYKRIVQKKIDLASLHRKITTCHGDLGKLIDDIRESGAPDILAKNEVQELFHTLDNLKAEAAALEHEIEKIKVEEAPEEELTEDQEQ